MSSSLPGQAYSTGAPSSYRLFNRATPCESAAASETSAKACFCCVLGGTSGVCTLQTWKAEATARKKMADRMPDTEKSVIHGMCFCSWEASGVTLA